MTSLFARLTRAAGCRRWSIALILLLPVAAWGEEQEPTPKPAEGPLLWRPTVKHSAGTATLEPRPDVRTPARLDVGETSVMRAEPLTRHPAIEQQPSPDQRPSLVSAYRLSRTARNKADFDRIIEVCQRALQQRPSPAEKDYGGKLLSWAHNRRGELLAREGDERAAWADFDLAVQLDPKRWRAVHNRGVSYYAMGHQAHALADFARTIQLEPRFATAYFNRGEVRLDRGDFSGAITDYNRALRYGSRQGAVYRSRAHAYFESAMYDAALKDLDLVISHSPQDAEAHATRGDAQARLENYEAAAGDYEQAIALDPRLGRAYASAAWLMATCPDAKFRNGPLAVQTARKAIELAGESSHESLNVLAAAYAANGQFDHARVIQTKAVQSAPQEIAAHYQQRLRLYQAKRPYRESPRRSRTATRPPAGQQRPF